MQTLRSRAISVDVSTFTFHQQLENRRWVENCLIWLTLGILLAIPVAGRGQQSLPTNRHAASEKASNRANVVANYGNLPLNFEANQGQADWQVRFLSRGNGYSLFLTDTAATLALTKRDAPLAEHGQIMGLEKNPASPSTTEKTDVIRMELAGANPSLRVAGDDRLAGITNYFIGNDPANWHRNVPTYGKVRYSGVYPGIDLVYYGNQRQLEYDFIVGPGKNPQQIQLHFAGAQKLKLTPAGDLEIIAENGQIAFHSPLIYQEKNGQRQTIQGRFILLADNRISFAIGQYDVARALVIDPLLAYSTYLGGTGATTDEGYAIAVDAEGSAFVTGDTTAPDFPTTAGGYQEPTVAKSCCGNGSIFVTKLSPNGTSLVYSTYLDGNQDDHARAITVDSSGNAFITGTTNSTNFPTTSLAYQPTRAAAYNVFVTKVNPAGSALIYSTYIGGNGNAVGSGIAVDASGNAFITGNAVPGFACGGRYPTTTGAFQTAPSFNGCGDTNAFITRLSADGSKLAYSTYLGGPGSANGTLPNGGGDYATAIAIDADDNAYVVGVAGSTTFPITTGAFQTSNNGSNTVSAHACDNAFVTKINAKGTALIYSTYLGGSGSFDTAHDILHCDTASSLAIDSEGNAYIGGITGSQNFPTTKGAYLTTNPEVAEGGFSTGFVAKLNPAGSALVYSTYLGGTDGSSDGVHGLRIDTKNNVYVTGFTTSETFPHTSGAYQTENPGASNLAQSPFVTELNPAGSGLLFSSYFSGSDGDFANALAVDSSGAAYITGQTGSTNFPTTTGAYQTKNDETTLTAFVAKLNITNPISPAATPTFTPPAGTYTGTQTVTITDATPGATIYYTTNGTTPTPASSKYTAAITVSATETIEAIAVATGYTNGMVASATYTIKPLPVVATPTFSPAGGSYPTVQFVTLSDTTAGATIFYTTNGTVPTTSSTKYTGPITVLTSEKIEAFAVEAGYTNSAVASATYTIVPSPTAELQFIPVTPCRIADTRNAAGAFGGPELAAAGTRTFNVPQSGCGIPASAVAYSLNVTVVPIQGLGYLTMWPAGLTQPTVSTLNSDGRVKANATITPAGTNGGVSVFATDATQFILDIDGYFVPAGSSASGLEFYPLTPCRIADTRNAAGALGGPSLAANVGRAFPVQSSSCGIPATAKAYSLNITAVPHGSLGFLTTWPTGQTQPNVSTLNASTGAVTANAAIVPAGTSGAVSIFVSDDADVILDVNGYFAPPATGGLSLYTITPCRVIDTRNGAGAFDGTLAVPVHGSSCAPTSTAKAYVLNATVVPTATLSYLSLWAAGGAQPVVSTLNASDGAVTSNMAIVPTTNGIIDAFATDPTNLLLDISSYFAP